jgi:hypothetical protein
VAIVPRTAALLTALLASMILATTAVASQTTVEVVGEAEVSLPADQAVLHLGVTTDAAAAKEAMEENARAMTAVVTALARAGFSGPDVVTRSVSLTPRMEYRERQEPRIVGYRANNTVQVTSRDPALIGRALDAGVQAGANVSGGLAFALADPRAAETQALRLAVQDAQRRAVAMADAMGKRLGRIIEVRSIEMERPMPRMEAMAARTAAAPPTPIEPGLITVRARVTLKAEAR